MEHDALERAAAAMQALRLADPAGEVSSVSSGSIVATGLTDRASHGDRVEILSLGRRLRGEVVRIDRTGVHLLAEGDMTGVAVGDPVRLVPAPRFAPHIGWKGRVIDPDGQPLDGRPLLPGPVAVPVRQPPPDAHARRPLGDRLDTGLAVMNTLLPLVRGQRIGLFAGSGVGKSTLLADLARGVAADVIVIALVGERGRELRHFTEEVLGPAGMARSVVVAATSDRAPQTRRRCALAATAVAEHFRDLGLQVLLLVDSVTRFCEAHREVSAIGGEAANLRGFPASTAGAIAGLVERAGPGSDDRGDITAIYTVLVAGSDMEEPVADMLRGVLDGHIVLDRAIAEAGRFPAIDVLRSVSRALPAAADRVENALLARARQRMSAYARAELMIQAGLYEAGSDAEVDAAIGCHSKLEDFLQVKDRRGIKGHYAALKTIVDAPG